MADRPSASGDARADEPARSGNVLEGQYRLDHELPGYLPGTVWQAVDLVATSGQPSSVLVRFYPPCANPEGMVRVREWFDRLALIDCGHVVKIRKFGRLGSTVYVVTNVVAGERLDRWMAGHPGGISIARAEPILDGIAAALMACDDRGVVIQSLSPANIAYDEQSEHATLFTFDLPPFIVDGPAPNPRYASPECLAGAAPSVRDDIHALACIAYEVLSGRLPFDGVTAQRARLNGRSALPLPNLSGTQNRILLRSLAPSRAQRLASVRQMLELFERPRANAERPCDDTEQPCAGTERPCAGTGSLLHTVAAPSNAGTASSVEEHFIGSAVPPVDFWADLPNLALHRGRETGPVFPDVHAVAPMAEAPEEALSESPPDELEQTVRRGPVPPPNHPRLFVKPVRLAAYAAGITFTGFVLGFTVMETGRYVFPNLYPSHTVAQSGDPSRHRADRLRSHPRTLPADAPLAQQSSEKAGDELADARSEISSAARPTDIRAEPRTGPDLAPPPAEPAVPTATAPEPLPALAPAPVAASGAVPVPAPVITSGGVPALAPVITSSAALAPRPVVTSSAALAPAPTRAPAPAVAPARILTPGPAPSSPPVPTATSRSASHAAADLAKARARPADTAAPAKARARAADATSVARFHGRSADVAAVAKTHTHAVDQTLVARTYKRSPEATALAPSHPRGTDAARDARAHPRPDTTALARAYQDATMKATLARDHQQAAVELVALRGKYGDAEAVRMISAAWTPAPTDQVDLDAAARATASRIADAVRIQQRAETKWLPEPKVLPETKALTQTKALPETKGLLEAKALLEPKALPEPKAPPEPNALSEPKALPEASAQPEPHPLRQPEPQSEPAPSPTSQLLRAAVPEPPPPPTGYWFYCRRPNGYYPYVRQCRGQWQRVPAGTASNG